MKENLRCLYSRRHLPVWTIIGVLLWSLLLSIVCHSYAPFLAEFSDNMIGGKRLPTTTLAFICYSRQWWQVPSCLVLLLVLVLTVPRSNMILGTATATAVSLAAIMCLLMSYFAVEGTRNVLQFLLDKQARTERVEQPHAEATSKTAPSAASEASDP